MTDPQRPDVDLERELVRYMAERRITRRMLLEQMAKVGAFAALAPIIAACSGAAASLKASAAAPSSAPATSAAATAAASAAAAATPTTAPTPVPSPESELFIYNWDGYIGETTQKDFEDKYGIKVKYDKFPDASTQITKIRSDGAGGGYDLTYPGSTDIAPLSRDGVISALDLSLIPNIKNLGPTWQDPAYDPGNKFSIPNYWWTTGIAWDPAKVKEDVTAWSALWDEKYKGKLGMLSDQQEVFAAGAFRLNLPPNPTSEADLDAILALLEQQKPLLRRYTEDDIGDFTSGQLWMTQAWSGDWVQMTADKPDAKYVIPSEGAIRGSDTMVVLSGAKHPIAAHLWIDFNLDAKVSAANSNYIGYMGPNAAAQQYILPEILSNPQLNPDAGVYNGLAELVSLEGPALDAMTKRWIELTT
ncbi:MAG: spermidine/putrescine ABC transporter substrate-binding protein [Chloroflexota bacterium]